MFLKILVALLLGHVMAPQSAFVPPGARRRRKRHQKPTPATIRGPWRSLDQVELATAEWVDWYDRQRLHGVLGDIPGRVRAALPAPARGTGCRLSPHRLSEPAGLNEGDRAEPDDVFVPGDPRMVGVVAGLEGIGRHL